MICYLPFTHLPVSRLADFFAQMGPMIIYTPDESLIPEHMRIADEDGRVEMRSPMSLAPGQLTAAIQAYQQWADLHQGNLSDMAGFFKAAKDRIPMMEETNPSQISTQIRRFETPGDESAQDLAFQAALFLSVAQAYDMQQDVMRRELGDVHRMEREMLAQLSGNLPDEDNVWDGTTQADEPADLEPGGYMTAARVEAWAQMAIQDADLPSVFLTDSPAVMDHLLDLFPEADKIVQLALSEPVAEGVSHRKLQDALKQIAGESSVSSSLFDSLQPQAGEGAAALTLFRLSGISPRVMLQRCNPAMQMPDMPPGDHKDDRHSVIGLIIYP